MELQSLTTDQIQGMDWYYSIELKKGAYTKNRVFVGTVALVRDLVARTCVENKWCLDIGTQEAIVATMMARNGGKTFAYDRLSLVEKIDFVKQAYNVSFEYVHGIQLHELPNELLRRSAGPFDLVVFAGVLYHMVNPLGGMATARSFLKQGGLMVLETAAVVSPEPNFAFNVEGSIYPGSNYFVPTLHSLDYMCRMMRLRPIDCAFIGASQNGICRIAVVCRAEDKPVSTESDTWMHSHWVTNDLKAIGLDFKKLVANDEPMPYEVLDPNNIVVRSETGSVDLYNTVVRCNSHGNLQKRATMNLCDEN